MRGLALLVFAAVMLSFAPVARAAPVLTSCTTGSLTPCTTDSSGSLQVDYTIPSNGQTYRWDLWSDASHPTAVITLAAPNDAFGALFTSKGDGTATQSFLAPSFTFNEIQAPGHTQIRVWAPADFNFCSSAPAAGTTCGISDSIFGDSSLLSVNVADHVTVTFTSTAVPEPAVWSLMIGGFGAVGWVLRRRRAAAGLPA